MALADEARRLFPLGPANTGNDGLSTAEFIHALADEIDRLREALGAYRSALRSGEPETERLRALGDAALGSGPQSDKEE